MREIVKKYLDKEISRRGFVKALGSIGLTLSAAYSVVESLEGLSEAEATELALTEPSKAGSYNITGTGGKLLVETMRSAGVKYLFTNPGSMERGLFDALLDDPDIHVIVGLHEGVVVAMADGYYKVSKQPSFVNVHTMVGTAQMAGQLYNAHCDGSAIVVTAAMIANNVFSDDVILGARPGFSQPEFPRQITKMAWDVKSPEGIPIVTRRAFKVATTQPGGPTYVAYPDTVFEAKGVTGEIIPAERFLIPTKIRPNAELIEKTAQMLIEAKNPLLFIGDEVSKARAQARAVELAELLAIPACSMDIPFEDMGRLTLRGIYQNFPNKHPLYIGGYTPLIKYPKDCDLIIIFSNRLFGISSEGWNNEVPQKPIIPKGMKTIQIGINTAEIGRANPFDLAIVADPGEAISDLIAAIKSRLTPARISAIKASRYEKISDYTRGLRQAALAVAKHNWDSNPVSPDRLGYEMDEHLDKEAIIVNELGAPLDLMDLSDGGRLYIGSTGGGLGWGLGASIGVKLAEPDRQVVCNIGDGSLMYSAAGFWTQARYGIPLLTIVKNNRNYETVRSNYFKYGGKMAEEGRFLGTYLGNPDIDFVLLAKSQGVAGERVTDPSELSAALKRGIEASKAGQPYLLEVITARVGPGAESTWHPKFSLSAIRKKKI